MRDMYSTPTADGGIQQTIVLTEIENDQIAQINSAIVDPDIAVFDVWSRHRDDDGTLMVAGTCPLCHRPHEHKLNSPVHLRYPHCSDKLPPFRNKPKPLYVQLRVNPGEMPEGFRYSIDVPKPDLLTMAARFYDRYSAWRLRRRRDRKPPALPPDEFDEAVQFLIDSGVFDERAGIMMADGERDEREVHRHLLAAFIKAQGPGGWLLRMARAFNKAWTMAGRGEQL